MWRAGFDECHGSDICSGTNWANVQSDAQASSVFSLIWLTVTTLFLLGNLVLVAKKHTAGLSISWQVLLFVQLLAVLLQIVLVPGAAVTLPAQALRATAKEVGGSPSPVVLRPYLPLRLLPPPPPPPGVPAIQFYEMAAKDRVCGNNLVALKDLDLGVWIDRPGDIDCEDNRWIGAPDPTDNLKQWSGFDPCADVTGDVNLLTRMNTPPPKGMYFALFTAKYTTVVLLQYLILYLIIYVLVLKDTCISIRKTAIHPALAAAVATPVALNLDPTALDYS